VVANIYHRGGKLSGKKLIQFKRIKSYCGGKSGEKEIQFQKIKSYCIKK
jgi:hypothetical protein